MPNNKVPITTLEKLEKKIKIAKEKIVCDVGLYFGSIGNNLEEFKKVQDKVLGLKLYLNQTTGNFLIDKNLLEKTYISWLTSKVLKKSTILPSIRLLSKNVKPILVHAEGKTIEDVFNIVKKIRVSTHFCHISNEFELKMIIKAKEQGLPITCGVTPHHLFLTEHDAKILGPFGQMKPSFSSKKDQDFLWKNLSY
jgi:dihydroorotase-like cyclic amidohydrolase